MNCVRPGTATGVFLILLLSQNKLVLAQKVSKSPQQKQKLQSAQKAVSFTKLSYMEMQTYLIHMTQADSENLERHLLKFPDDFDSHAKLVGYYYFHLTPEGSQRKMGHILWIIRHHPESEIAGDVFCAPVPFLQEDGANAKQAWQDQVAKYPHRADILGNAGNCLKFLDDTDAVPLLLRAHILDPKNPQWLSSLAEYYLAQISLDRENVSKAYEYYQQSFDLTKGFDDRLSLLLELTPVALEAEHFEATRKYGALLLEMARHAPKSLLSDTAIYEGHTVLGQLAIRNGHIEEAKQHLLKSADISKMLLGGFYLDTSLAQALLKKGERKTVSEFLTRCKRFCKRAELDDWISEVERGLMPDFDKLPVLPK